AAVSMLILHGFPCFRLCLLVFWFSWPGFIGNFAGRPETELDRETRRTGAGAYANVAEESRLAPMPRPLKRFSPRHKHGGTKFPAHDWWFLPASHREKIGGEPNNRSRAAFRGATP